MYRLLSEGLVILWFIWGNWI